MFVEANWRACDNFHVDLALRNITKGTSEVHVINGWVVNISAYYAEILPISEQC